MIRIIEDIVMKMNNFSIHHYYMEANQMDDFLSKLGTSTSKQDGYYFASREMHV